MLRVTTPLDDEAESLVRATIGCCIAVHRELGPGLLEAIYQRAVGHELAANRIPYERERSFPVAYRGHQIYVHRADMVIGGQILLELKAVESLHPVHRAQVLSCLRVTKLRVGLLINFNVAVLVGGLQRIVL
jgi:GxxExxY protein